ncbi:hypothetical protein [Bradyrhizobium sp. AS23.2]|uniref:hypothetical protein n=1 Tax=Bradyrhizobium sp. AS23.2 TaxID=1680155 RepID=UPI001FDA7775|nr:hypothetical protein [Bradyrhizobium sp. AS23.2]
MLGVEFPLLAFSHCRDVVAAAKDHQPRSFQLDRSRSRRRQRQGARSRQLFVSQGVGLIDSVNAVVQEFKEEFAEAILHMNAVVAE